MVRFFEEAGAGRWADATESLFIAARIDPANARVIEAVPLARQAALADALAGARDGERQPIERALRRAEELGTPSARIEDFRRRAARIRSAAIDVVAHRDDFEALRREDAALATAGRLDLVVERWTDYLARHPDDGRAYLERGGAEYHQRDLEASERDARRACQLGIQEGCARASQVAALRR